MTDNSKPTPEDAINFRKAVDTGLTKKNALLPGYIIDYDSEVRDKVLSHKFYTWLASQRKFQKAIKYLSDKSLMGDWPDRRKIEIAKCVAIIYRENCYYSSHPEWLIRTTAATGLKALKSINPLLALLDSDLQMERFSDSTDLQNLLLKLKGELSGGLPTTYPTSSRGNILGARLVQDMHYIIKHLIGKAPTFVIFQLVSTMRDVSEQQVRRYTKKIKATS